MIERNGRGYLGVWKRSGRLLGMGGGYALALWDVGV